ncbi:hypothetical protein [Rhodococcus sp. WS3]|uniref:hypothetical protein n=1 Tax=Rhodococcus sp. WS3 TaxID=2486271 RepID=UPI001141E50E|nr:hypothetical protein [Rhodococcus sp. WS3]
MSAASAGDACVNRRTTQWRYANPIDKAFKRVDNGSQDSLVSFWTAVGPESAGKRRRWFLWG